MTLAKGFTILEGVTTAIKEGGAPDVRALDSLFSSSDHQVDALATDWQPSPDRIVYEWIQDVFAGPLHENLDIAGSAQIETRDVLARLTVLKSIWNRYGTYLSQIQRSTLCTCQGILLAGAALATPHDAYRINAHAVDAFREAIELRAEWHGFDQVRSHTMWLAAALLGKLQRWQEAATLLFGVIEIDPLEASSGLYLGFASRYFMLPEEERRDLWKQVEPLLMRAFIVMSPVEENTGESPQRGVARILPPGLKWSGKAADRLGLLAVINSSTGSGALKDLCRVELKQLYQNRYELPGYRRVTAMAYLESEIDCVTELQVSNPSQDAPSDSVSALIYEADRLRIELNHQSYLNKVQEIIPIIVATGSVRGMLQMMSSIRRYTRYEQQGSRHHAWTERSLDGLADWFKFCFGDPVLGWYETSANDPGFLISPTDTNLSGARITHAAVLESISCVSSGMYKLSDLENLSRFSCSDELNLQYLVGSVNNWDAFLGNLEVSRDALRSRSILFKLSTCNDNSQASRAARILLDNIAAQMRVSRRAELRQRLVRDASELLPVYVCGARRESPNAAAYWSAKVKGWEAEFSGVDFSAIDDPQVAISWREGVIVMDWVIGQSESTLLIHRDGEVNTYRLDCGNRELSQHIHALAGPFKRRTGATGPSLQPLEKAVIDGRRDCVTDLESAWISWKEFSRKLIPHEAAALCEGAETILLSPHRFLRNQPLHCLALPGDRLLFECYDVGYVPACHNLPAIESPRSPSIIAYVNVDASMVSADFAPALSNTGVRLLDTVDGHVDKWLITNSLSDDLLLMTHGYFDANRPAEARLQFPKGARLTSVDVLTASASLGGAFVCVLACNSGRISKSANRLVVGIAESSVAQAIFAKGASGVLSCLWDPFVKHAERIMIDYATERMAGASFLHAYTASLRQVASASDCPMARIARAGSYVAFVQ